MMADLLSVDWTPINETLVSFSENRIERFLYIEVENAVSKSEGYALLKAFQRGCFTSLPLYNIRSKS
jgi:hypothetical protein